MKTIFIITATTIALLIGMIAFAPKDHPQAKFKLPTMEIKTYQGQEVMVYNGKFKWNYCEEIKYLDDCVWKYKYIYSK